ncbi:hypothetical protein ABT263_26635 [Kitasatospora sp. NPDC001603]|uniref:hypothetical protein n=1 Tax=Kitasatospora sp. NPDC001603 TaxID=3154388 RepID=UPI003323212C
MLAKAGIAPPRSFDALAAAARALTTSSTTGLFVGNDGIGDTPALAVFSRGGALVTDGRADFDSPQAVEAMSALKRLREDQSLTGGTRPRSPRASCRCSGAVSGRCRP